jgi:F-type H+/Na+-transporting ATPase subunit alpha
MAFLRVDKINKILRQCIEQCNRKEGIENIGSVVQVGDGIARIIGLGEIMLGELGPVCLPHGLYNLDYFWRII